MKVLYRIFLFICDWI